MLCTTRRRELHGCKNRDEAPDQCKDPTFDVGTNVPGAKASTLRIHSVWHVLGRHVLEGHTRFAVFYRQMLKKRRGLRDGGRTTSQLPMPLPFNLSGKSDVRGEELAFRKILNLQVGYLNYLHLGMPASPPNYICQPGELNSAHWKIVERLRRLCKVWNQTVEVNADDMGRFAAKQERQEGVLEDLFKLASSSSRSLKNMVSPLIV